MIGEIMKKKLVLSSGEVFYGEGFNFHSDVISEIVFNTSVAGYQEIISDNSYCNQCIVMSFSLIGSYGINDSDFESIESFCDFLIVKELQDDCSHYESTKTLKQFLVEQKIGVISEIDTRQLIRVIRDSGSQNCLVTDVDVSDEECFKKLKLHNTPKNHVDRVSTKKPYRFENNGFKIICLDFGIKLNIIRELQNCGFDVTILPYDSSVEKILSYNADGLFLSNGPGDPRDLTNVIENIKVLQKSMVIFGICLGHQLIALANECVVSKMKFGHRGANHPVQCIETQKIEITSQNHSYCVSEINSDLVEVTHINLLDGTVEGIRHKKFNVFSVQYHPESAPGPVDSLYLFEKFKNNIIEFKENNGKKN